MTDNGSINNGLGERRWKRKRCLIFLFMIIFSLTFLRSGEERIIQIGSAGGVGELVFPRNGRE